MNNFFIALLLLPIGINIFNIYGKPVFFVLSDLTIFYFIFLIIYKSSIKINRHHKNFYLIVLISILYQLIIGFSGTFFDNSLTPLASSIKLAKTHIFFLIGLLSIQMFDEIKLLNIFQRSSVLIIIILLISDIIWGRFPTPRLGGNFIGLEVYGFPNSAAVFYTILFAFGFTYIWFAKSLNLKISIFILSLIMILIIIGTLSRAGFVSLAVFLALVFLLKSKKSFLITFLYVIVFTLFLGYISEYQSDLFHGLNAKVTKFTSGADFSDFHGRGHIWSNCIDLIMTKPFFGFFYEPFSNYNLQDTPHNQYLEIFYKLGLIGAIFYYFPFIYCSYRIFFKNLGREDLLHFTVLRVIYITIFFSIMITNMVQPKLSYTPTSSFIYFFSGYLAFLRPSGPEERTLDLPEQKLKSTFDSEKVLIDN